MKPFSGFGTWFSLTQGCAGAYPAKQRHTTPVRRSAKILYPLHPLYGEDIEIVGSYRTAGTFQIKHPEATTLNSVVPAWILDPIACSQVRYLDEPHPSLRALRRLRSLLDAQPLLDAPMCATPSSCEPPKAQGGRDGEQIPPASTRSRRSASLGSTRGRDKAAVSGAPEPVASGNVERGSRGGRS